MTNCRTDAIVLSPRPIGDRVEPRLVDIPHTLPPRTAWTLHAIARDTGTANVSLTLTSTVYREWGYVDHGRTTRTWREPVVMSTMGFGPSILVTIPQLDVAIRACTACNATWGVPHMTGVEQSCNCRTKDAGKRCLDGDDCEGVCEFVKFDIVKAATGSGYAEGKCSERVYDPCVDYIPHGARARGPTSSYEASKTCE